jgi:hypothetical protein
LALQAKIMTAGEYTYKFCLAVFLENSVSDFPVDDSDKGSGASEMG